MDCSTDFVDGLQTLSTAATNVLGLTPRGIRNNNAGNIRYTPSGSTGGWRGAIPMDKASDKSYMQFDTAQNGLRAMGKLLWNYQLNSGRNTIHEVISKWAPSTENNTPAYVEKVANDLGVGIHDEIDVRSSLVPLMKAIIWHENGYAWRNYYSDAEIQSAIDII